RNCTKVPRMTEERTRALVGECISRAHVDAARSATLAEITAACDACDYERAATLVLGRARAGEAVPVDAVMRVLPGIELPAITLALIAIVPTSERTQLFELLTRRRFPQVRDAGDLEAIVLYASARAGADVARVIPELRRLSARTLSAESYALLAALAATIDDPHVAAATKPIAPFAKEYAKQVAEDDRTLASTIDKVLATLPAEIEVARAAGFTVRAQKQVGRNDPCPCGSGLKYKKCCADKDDARDATPSPVPGMSYDEFLGSGADRMTIEHVDELPLRDVARIDIARLGDEPLEMACKRMTDAHEWAHAERMLIELERRGGGATDAGVSGEDDRRYELVLAAFDCGELELARKHVAKLSDELAGDFALDLAIADGPEQAWRTLRARAVRALTGGDKLADIDLAYTMLRAEPALGIYFARACVGALHLDDGETLMNIVEEARDQLNLPPEDPAWSVLDALNEAGEREHGHADHERGGKLNDALAESTARIDELERKLSAARTQLDHARTRPAAELLRVPEQRDVLDDRVAKLEALIREGNAERRELRKQLETRAPEEPSRREGPRARRATIEESDDDAGDDVELGTRGVTIPRFERRAIDALAAVPATVASETMRTVGNLAAGDGFSWRTVKQAKDMVRPVLMARVGIHHRVLFRVEEGALDVIDLITREQLLTTLKRLRSSR
ncbi:MAG TPA: SEC-C metal-binding domain-containing protein, partial [Kofleriaceae bacterium]